MSICFCKLLGKTDGLPQFLDDVSKFQAKLWEKEESTELYFGTVEFICIMCA